MQYPDDKLVEAIEEGRIVKVPEFYAKQEGLAIIRKPTISQLQEDAPPIPPMQLQKSEPKSPYDYRKAASNWRDKQVTSELIENWNWKIRIDRRKKGLSRGQFAKLLNVNEETIKMLEYGALPSADFVLINKIQGILKLNLRKDKKDYSQGVKELMVPPKEAPQRPPFKPREPKQSSSSSSISGADIEILEEEI